MESSHKKIRSFVIRASRTSSRQKKNYDQLLPIYGIPYKPEGTLLSESFGPHDLLVVEIGFGMGDATLELAQKFPLTAFVGVDVHLPGVGRVLGEIQTQNLTNLKIIHHDAVEVLDTVASQSVDGFHIFFPDPWPKKKHHKRRLLQQPFVKKLVEVLKPGGYLYFATDWEEYALEVRDLLRSFGNLSTPYTDWAEGIDWRPNTKFERRGVQEQRPIRELFFRKENSKEFNHG